MDIAPPLGAGWSRISIVTPSFNQGRFIEETIRSVLLQGYPDLEYIIIDGGSTDETVPIIRKYEPWLTYWVSEKDRGQSHAINKGLAVATGEWFGWLNSDDYLLPHASLRWMELATGTDCVALFGAIGLVNAEGEDIGEYKAIPGNKEAIGDWAAPVFLPQPGSLFLRAVCQAIGGVNERMYYAMDVELFMRLADQGSFAITPDRLACLRSYEGTKTSNGAVGGLVEVIVANYNLGLPHVAERFLRRNMDGHAGVTIDRLSDAQIAVIVDRWSPPKVMGYVLGRLGRQLKRRLLRRTRGRAP